MPLAIETEGLEKEYGDLKALEGVDIEVEDGEFFGLLGPNGAGKTTFINILVGLVKKSRGEARVFGYDVEDDYQKVRDIVGIAPQEFNVDRFFSIQEVLEHKAGYHGVASDEATRRAEKALRTVGIYDKRDTRFDWLSGGMKRRFMLARAMVTDPDLLILDEPTAGVDVQLRHDLWDIIREMNQDGTTILLTTHYIEEAERLCERVAILDEGEKIEVASPDDLTDRGVDRLRFRLRETPEEAPSVCRDNPQVVGTELRDGEVVVESDCCGEVAPEVIKELESEGHEILDMEMSRTSLEEIFVDMTREETDSEAEAEGRC
ncbi:MAG: ABC transporter ATP-binding protein [Halobacteria archaeon]|nr:ABC transporter ATP-binding protein [Halobacteria archaeon]